MAFFEIAPGIEVLQFEASRVEERDNKEDLDAT
jgi:hypothetical protein